MCISLISDNWTRFDTKIPFKVQNFNVEKYEIANFDVIIVRFLFKSTKFVVTYKLQTFIDKKWFLNSGNFVNISIIFKFDLLINKYLSFNEYSVHTLYKFWRHFKVLSIINLIIFHSVHQSNLHKVWFIHNWSIGRVTNDDRKALI